MEQHHQLPSDEWSSDIENEQKLSSPGECPYYNHHVSVSLSFLFVIVATQQPLANIPPAMEHHSQYLKDLYKRRSGMSLKWPPVLMTDFVNLLCIDGYRQQDEQLMKQMVCGHIDEVENVRRTVKLEDLAPVKNGEPSNCILVQGAPGSGKTMFSWEVCHRWGQGKLLQHYPLVVMLPLRDPDIQNARSLKDLFPHDHKPFQKDVAATVGQEAGKGVLFLLDGFDELPSIKRQESSLCNEVNNWKTPPTHHSEGH